MAKEFVILRQEGFILNPDDKIVNGILKGIKKCKGLCPCYHGEEEISEEDLTCPCKEYRENKHCRCNLYILKEPQNVIDPKYVEELERKLNDMLSKDAEVAKEINKPLTY